MPKLKGPYQPPKGYLTAAGAAAKVGVSTRTWWKYRMLKIAPPGTWVGGRLIWREQAIDVWLLGNEEGGTARPPQPPGRPQISARKPVAATQVEEPAGA
jgi:hypothetical protein